MQSWRVCAQRLRCAVCARERKQKPCGSGGVRSSPGGPGAYKRTPRSSSSGEEHLEGTVEIDPKSSSFFFCRRLPEIDGFLLFLLHLGERRHPDLEKVSILTCAKNSGQRKCTVNNAAFILAPLPGRPVSNGLSSEDFGKMQN
ncbi:hypothetical protein Taro_002976 [Colocasia esculenta]|uniref:Uncharacterized protein n=1 Tax=Colocasia esculenta TaxID=4460 RepID=A0A843TMG9_COLES|nr:hypothetical protein [Colocasia esculenta]